MAFYIENAIDDHALSAITDVLNDESVFTDGKHTAGGFARQVKDNLQANLQHQTTQGAIKLIEQSLRENQTVKSAVYPAKFAKTMISRYEADMHYGEHVDEAFINNTRTDIAFTLFLSAPEAYAGGELEIVKSDGRDVIKLPAGSAYIYPADTIHQVLPVTSGVRLAAVGWIQSRIRLQQQRDILFDITNAIAQLPDVDKLRSTRLTLLKTRSNLERLWGD